MQGGAAPDEQTTVGFVDGGTITVVDLGGDELLKLRQPPSARGINNANRYLIRITRSFVE